MPLLTQFGMEQVAADDLVVGVDEAGRGPLAGPVFAAAVIFDPAVAPIAGLNDSKLLTATRRAALYEEICRDSLAWAIAMADVEEIDRLNILQATMLAMQRAVQALHTAPTQALVDGNRSPALPCPAVTVVNGDKLVPVISAASILAKHARDQLMLAYEQEYPGYGFAKHKGYGTAEHLTALRDLGPSPIHRRSFKPVRDLLVEKES